MIFTLEYGFFFFSKFHRLKSNIIDFNTFVGINIKAYIYDFKNAIILIKNIYKTKINAFFLFYNFMIKNLIFQEEKFSLCVCPLI